MYGNTKAVTASNPSTVFTLFEDFETAADAAGTPGGGWGLDANVSKACGVAAPDATAFTVSNDVALSGSKSLKVSGATKTGGGFVKSVSAGGLGNAFVLKAYLRDSGCTGSFWISPDFTTCASEGGGGDGKAVLSSTARAVGVHSCATPTHYAATYPWEASTASATAAPLLLFRRRRRKHDRVRR